MSKTIKQTTFTQLEHNFIISFIYFFYVLAFPNLFLSHMVKSPTINPMYSSCKKIKIIFIKNICQNVSSFRNITDFKTKPHFYRIPSSLYSFNKTNVIIYRTIHSFYYPVMLKIVICFYWFVYSLKLSKLMGMLKHVYFIKPCILCYFNESLKKINIIAYGISM